MNPMLREFLSEGGMRGSGLLGAGMLGGLAGYTMGDQSFASFASGAAAGVTLGVIPSMVAPGAARGIAKGFQTMAAGATDEAQRLALTAKSENANALADVFTSQGGRQLAYSAGGMLAGGAFGAMFMSHNRTNHRRGFNQHRGNSF